MFLSTNADDNTFVGNLCDGYSSADVNEFLPCPHCDAGQYRKDCARKVFNRGGDTDRPLDRPLMGGAAGPGTTGTPTTSFLSKQQTGDCEPCATSPYVPKKCIVGEYRKLPEYFLESYAIRKDQSLWTCDGTKTDNGPANNAVLQLPEQCTTCDCCSPGYFRHGCGTNQNEDSQLKPMLLGSSPVQVEPNLWAGECLPCILQSSGTGQATCKAGEFAAGGGTSKSTGSICSSGEDTFGEHSSGLDCKACPPGFYCQKNGNSSSGYTYSVIPCPAGEISDDENATACSHTACPKGSSCAAGSSSKAASDKYLKKYEAGMNIGTFVALFGNDSKKVLDEAGYFHRPVPCANGTVATDSGGNVVESGATQCLDCQAGNFSSSPTTACAPCEPGTYSSLAGAAKCSDCPSGKYQPTVGQTSCLVQPNGTFVAGRASQPQNCSKGTFCAVGAQAPAGCPPGYCCSDESMLKPLECRQCAPSTSTSLDQLFCPANSTVAQRAGDGKCVVSLPPPRVFSDQLDMFGNARSDADTSVEQVGAAEIACGLEINPGNISAKHLLTYGDDPFVTTTKIVLASKTTTHRIGWSFRVVPDTCNEANPDEGDPTKCGEKPAILTDPRVEQRPKQGVMKGVAAVQIFGVPFTTIAPNSTSIGRLQLTSYEHGTEKWKEHPTPGTSYEYGGTWRARLLFYWWALDLDTNNTKVSVTYTTEMNVEIIVDQSVPVLVLPTQLRPRDANGSTLVFGQGEQGGGSHVANRLDLYAVGNSDRIRWYREERRDEWTYYLCVCMCACVCARCVCNTNLAAF